MPRSRSTWPSGRPRSGSGRVSAACRWTGEASLSVVILGAGLAGLSTAYHLDQPGAAGSGRPADYLILEKEQQVGGLASSQVVEGFTFDQTGHFLHLRDESMRGWIGRLMGPSLRPHIRSSWIFSHRIYTRYPYQANTYGLPRRVVRDCVEGFVEAALMETADTGALPPVAGARGSFADWCLRTFGRGISREFMFPYNEKLWTVPLDRLTTDWMGRFVPRPKVAEVVEGGLLDQRKGFGYNAAFLYPRQGGIQALAASIAGRVRAPHLGEEVVAVDLDRRRVASASGAVHDFDWLVSTLPLPRLIRTLTVRPPEIARAASALSWNTILNINFGVDRPDVARGRHWIYFPEKRYPFYRVGFPSAISPTLHPRGTSSLYVEVAFPPGAPVDVSGSVRACRRGLETAGLLRKSDRILVTHINRIHCAYVIYDRQRNAAVKLLRDWLAARRVLSIGRYGGWCYASMEDALLDGVGAAETIRGGRPHPGGHL